MQRAKKKRRRLARIILCVGLAVWLACNPWQVNRSVALAQQKAQLKAKQQEQLEKLADRLEKMFSALEEAQKEIPRDTFDPEVIIKGQEAADIEGVGKDPEEIFEWVRDNTYLVPYRGALRGHKGVLMDRLGNSLDRALLLAKLLRIAGHKQLRLWRAELAEETAWQILDDAQPIPEEGALPRRESSTKDLAQRLEEYAEKYDLDPADMQRAIDKMNLKSQRLATKAVQRTHEQSQALLQMLEEKIDIPSAKEQRQQLREDAVEDYRHHWWLEYHDGSDWVALDPTMPDAQRGDSIGSDQQGKLILTTEDLDDRKTELSDEADEQGEQDAAKDLVLNVDAAIAKQVEGDIEYEDALPWKHKHRVGIRVKIERWNDGQLEQLPVLEVTLSPLTFIGKRIALHHVPHDWDPNILKKLQKAKDPGKELKKAVLAQEEWTPVLTVGEHRITNLSFTDTGQLNDPDFPFAKVAAARQLSKTLSDSVETFDPFAAAKRATGSDLFQKSKPVDPPQEKAQLTAEWIEYVLLKPGGNTQIIRRQIFDLVGTSRRSKSNNHSTAQSLKSEHGQKHGFPMHLIRETEILASVTTISADFANHLVVQAALLNHKQVHAMLQPSSQETSQTTIPDAVFPLKHSPTHTLPLEIARHAWNYRHTVGYLGCINLVTYHRWLTSHKQGQVTGLAAYDIVHNKTSISPSAERKVFESNLMQGVLDTTVEDLLSLNEGESMAPSLAGIDDGWIVILPNKIGALEQVDMSSDAEARVRQHVRNGRIAVIKKELPSGTRWWSIDPHAGTALGMSYKGWGAPATEKAFTDAVLVISFVALVFTTFACFLAVGVGGPAGAAIVCAVQGFLGLLILGTIAVAGAGLAGLVGAILALGGAALGLGAAAWYNRPDAEPGQ